MTTLAYSHTLVAGTPENINDVQDMFNDVKTAFNGNIDATNLAASAKPATILGAYRTVAEMALTLTSSNTGATTYTASAGGSPFAVGSNLSSGSFLVVPLTVTDYAVSGLTTQFRIQASTMTNTVAPAANFTFALASVASTAGSGGNLSIASIGALQGSVGRTAPGASLGLIDAGSDFTATTNLYVLCVASSATPAAGSATGFQVRLQVHHI